MAWLFSIAKEKVATKEHGCDFISIQFRQEDCLGVVFELRRFEFRRRNFLPFFFSDRTFAR